MDWDKRTIEELAQVITQYDLTEVEIQNGDIRISVKKALTTAYMLQGYQGLPMSGIQSRGNAEFRRITEKKARQDELEISKAAHKDAPPVKPSVGTLGNPKYLTSPIAGIFYRQPQPETPPYVEVGQSVKRGDTVCLVEAMKMINEITADRDGVVKEFLADNEQFVEYGAPLVLIEEV